MHPPHLPPYCMRDGGNDSKKKGTEEPIMFS